MTTRHLQEDSEQLFVMFQPYRYKTS